MEELRRRMSSAKAWGIEAELVTPGVRRRRRCRSSTPTRSSAPSGRPASASSTRCAPARSCASARWRPGALTVVPNVEVDRPRRRGRPDHAGRAPTGGDIEAEYVVIACGVWSPKIGDMAGVSIPLTPAVHQMISVGPCPQLAEHEGEISFPIVRDMDTFCYERQHGADMEVGSYAHRAILHEPEDIPSIEQAKLSPTEMPFTSDDFDPQLEQAYELMPELLGAEGAEIRYAINGLLSLTCDGSPILGESQVKGLWTAAAVWIKEGPGVGRAVAEWMTHGHSEIDVAPQRHRAVPPAPDAPRAHPAAHHRVVHQDLRDHPPGRAVRVRPRPAARRRCTSPQQKLGAVFFETAGWERPHWYESNAGLRRGVRRRRDAARARVGLALVEPDHQRRAPADARGRRRHRPDGVPDLRHRRARARSTPCSAPASRSATSRSARSSTRPVLDAKGGFRSDLTVMRLGDDHFRVVTGGAHGMADRKWFADHLPDDGADARPTAPTRSPRSACGVRGPATSSPSLTDDDVSDEGFGFLTCREITVGAATHRARLADLLRRRARLGALRRRWTHAAAALGRRCSRPAPPHGAVPVGIGVYGTTGRIEKGYRAFGYELDAERTHRRGRHAAAQGEGRRLRRQGGLPRAARGGARRRCCAR